MSSELPQLPKNAGGILLPLARSAIAARLGTAFVAYGDAPWLHTSGASFITLKQGEKLRGCIGTLSPHRHLDADVQGNAVAAAFSDPRFEPVTPQELDSVTIEVSVLSAIEMVVFRNEDDALAQLRPGIDGLIFEYGHHRSTFLPQVWEDFAEARLFMSNLKYKAGLPPDFWDATVKLSRYTVSKWRE